LPLPVLCSCSCRCLSLFFVIPHLSEVEWGRNLLLAVAVAYSAIHQKTVISTEAAHGIIVTSAAEKSASLPPPFANPHRAVAVAVVLSRTIQKPLSF
jgi:hypothetical protein